MRKTDLTRRDALGTMAGWLGAHTVLDALAGPVEGSYQLATFSADITVPLGHALMGGGIAPAQKIEDALSANGVVFLGPGKPIVLVALDWCEVRNDAYYRWQSVLAKAAQTEPARVLVTCIHQHDAPIADLEAQQLLNQVKAKGSICDPEFHETAVQRVAKALRESRRSFRKVTHYGVGQARVENVASNRRYPGPDGKVRFNRTSATRDPSIRSQPEGTVDPWLKTLSFWDGDRAVVALSCYATHPMSYYGKGIVSSDFIGIARQRRQADDPAVTQIYVSGCSGNVTAGKYNDGSPENRPVLAGRIYQAMQAAWKSTVKHPLARIGFHAVPMKLEPRNDEGFTVAELQRRLKNDPKPFGQCLAALGLSWRKRADAAHSIDLPVLDLGKAQLLLLPGESYVEFQLMAQKLRQDSFVMTMGYGECATGYVPIEKAFAEGDTNLNDWCWVAPSSDQRVTAALRAALKPSR